MSSLQEREVGEAVRKLEFKRHRCVQFLNFRVECPWFQGLAAAAQTRERLSCTKAEKCLMPLYIRVFRDFLYIIYLLQRLF